MRIGTLGTGNMARNLVGRWAEAGHAVFFGSRDPAKARDVAAQVGHGARGGPNDESAAFGDVVLHTVRIPPARFLNEPAALDGKVLVDLNNHDFPRQNPWESIAAPLAKAVQDAHPRSHVVKAFNTMAMEVFDHAPDALRREQVSAFIAGDDAKAVELVKQLAGELGLVPVVTGGLDTAWLLEVQADFIRNQMGQEGSPLVTVNTRQISSPPAPAFGGRKTGGY